MQIATSILNSNNRVESVSKLNRTNTSYIHIDVMDGKFVPDTQFNKFNEINAINMVSKYPLDIHLMVESPIEYICQLNNMKIEFITFHIEVEKDINKLIDAIKEKGYKVGIAIKPNTKINKLEPYLDKIDMILVMSVEPGKGGQTFISTTTTRIEEVRKLMKDKNILIEVDGGINDKTIIKIQDANIAVVGSYIINSDNYYTQIDKLLKKFEQPVNKKIVLPEKLKIFIIVFIVHSIILFLIATYNSIVGYQICLAVTGCSDIIRGTSAFLGTLIVGYIIFLWYCIPIILLIIILKVISFLFKNH